MSQPAHFAYRPDIDGLRAIAILMVVLFHAGLGFTGGYVGVDVFFVISGYLITGLLLKEAEAGGIDLAGFWERRIRRIFPALTVMTCATLAAGALLLLPEAFQALGDSAMAQSLLVSNLHFWRDSGYFAAAAEQKPLLHTWSLAVEEQFYLFLPLLLAWLLRSSGAPKAPGAHSRLRRWLAALLAGSLVLSLVAVPWNPNTAFYWLPTRAWELLLGALLASLPAPVQPPQLRTRQRLGWAGLLLIVGSGLAYESDTPFPGAAALPPCLGAALVIWSNAHPQRGAGFTPHGAGRLLACRPLVLIGLLSYSLYLWHWPLLALGNYLNVSAAHAPALSVRLALLALSFLLAALSWRWVETPFRRRRWLGSRRAVFGFGLATSLLVLALGGLIRAGRGLPQRLPEAALRYAEGARDKAEGASGWVNLDAARQGQFPRFGSPAASAPVQLMVWGDSHARSLLPALETLCRERGVAGLSAAHSATSPTLGFHRRSRHGLNERTELLGQAVLRQVREQRIPHTLLTAYWRECPGREPERFGTALLATVRALREAGTRVWVLLDVPDQPLDVPKALALHALHGGWFADPRALATPLAHHRESNAVMESLRARLEQAGAQILDPAPLLSRPDGRTRIEHDGRSLYSDHHHLSRIGALHLRPLLEPLLAAPRLTPEPPSPGAPPPARPAPARPAPAPAPPAR